MAKVYSTPGVYIEEKNAFPNSVVAVETAVPAFIGYTEKAMRGKRSLHNVPTRISSFAEYVSLFGGAAKTTFTISPDAKDNYKLNVDKATQYYLFASMRLFYANGGGPCYIVSVGDYNTPIKAADLNNYEKVFGIQSLTKEQEPTMVVIPDAMLLERNDCYSLQVEMVKHCGKDMRNRVAVLDVYEGYKERTRGDDDVITNFRSGIGINTLAFGAAYYPWLETTIIQANEIDYTNVSNVDVLIKILKDDVDDDFKAGILTEKRAKDIKLEIDKLKPAAPAPAAKPKAGDKGKAPAAAAKAAPVQDIESVSNTLKAVSPVFKEVLEDLRAALNILPPSGAIAGIYSMVDNAVGVHKAPANVSVSGVVGPVFSITAETQEDLNLPLDGKAVNAIRHFIGKGTLVWGARTLDGNSQDWRYISVRRTVIMIEESIRIAAGAYVFEPNDANTWVSIKGMLENFLTNQWKSGALVGAIPADAFSVNLGLGVTMTPQDVLDGLMRISIKIAVSRPAEFIVITFQQQMQKS